METFLKTDSSFFCNWYTHESLDMGCLDLGTQFPWITPHILRKLSVCFSGFPIASGIQLHSPGKGRVKVHLQTVIILCPVNDNHCTVLLTFKLTTLVDRQLTGALKRSEYSTHFITGIRQFCTGFVRWGSLWTAGIWVTQGPLDSSKLVKMNRPCVRRQLEDQETTYRHQRHPSKFHTFLPVWWCAVKRCGTQHDLGLARTDCWDQGESLFVHSCVLLTGDITADWIWWESFFRLFWNLLIRHWWLKNYWKKISECQDEFPWTDQLEMEFA